MPPKTDAQIRELALSLLAADSESEVISILKKAGYWEDESFWRLYGDKEGNFAQAGNQQALPEAALVEKIINSCDSRLMSECVIRGIDPESDKAPQSVREAVALFIEGRTKFTGESGRLSNWTGAQRTEQARFITIAATGDRPPAQERNMCITIVDQAEGQSPERLPRTILSLNEKNKQRIRFVQGKFNMGGSGALRFCKGGLQLVITRRNPKLASKDDSSSGKWAVTIVRREEPSNKSGDPVHSEFTYLAPVDADKNPRKGHVLSFAADELALMPIHDEPYAQKIGWGTAIKLYEFETSSGKSNVLLKNGLMFALERLLPEIALPIRIHECRGYKGEKERSFETTIAGLVVRLEEGKGDNLEPGFPLSVKLRVRDIDMTARIYAFREDKAETYLRDEGVIFAINGQAHGYLPKSIFTRKAVGLPRLRNSLLVLADCSLLSVTQREDLFMSSRDRLSKKSIRYDIETEIEELLKVNPELRRLQQERRNSDVQESLSDDKPLEEVIGRILKSSPTLRSIFLLGKRLSRPFQGGGSGGGQGGGQDETQKEFKGARHPTYFRFPGIPVGKEYRRTCEIGRRARMRLETDVENGYFDRATERGVFGLDILDPPGELSEPNYSLTLEDGSAYLNMSLPSEVKAGETIVFNASVTDKTLVEPFNNVFRLTVMEHHEHPKSDGSKPKTRRGGGEDDASQEGVSLPTPIPVKENDKHWIRHKFTPDTACHVESDPVEENGKVVEDHTFYINIDNNALKTEMKYSKQDPRLLEAKFKYANVLIGMAMLHDDARRNGSAKNEQGEEESENGRVQDKIRAVTQALAPVMIPIIEQLSGLTEDQLEETSTIGDDG